MSAILLATTNKSKVERIRKLLKAFGSDVEAKTPTDLGIEPVETEEGSDLLANARDKARSYFGQTDLPILGTDTGFFLDNEILDPAMVKRNALGGRDESVLSRQEIKQAFLDFYIGLARKHGGQAEAYWKDVFVLVMPDGTEKAAEGIRPVILTDKVHGQVDDFFPMRSLYYSKTTGRFTCDATEEDEKMELGPYSEALIRLMS